MTYSPFFQTLYDEQVPTGHLGRGTHASIFRAVVFHNADRTPLRTAEFADFAVVWDEDHDTRVIEAVELIYRLGFLGSLLMIGERKGTLNAIVSDNIISLDTFKYLEKELHDVAQAMDDPWSSSLNRIENPGGDMISDNGHAVSLYLANLKSLWRLGPKKIDSRSDKLSTGDTRPRIRLGEIWRGPDGARAVVVQADSGGYNGRLYFEDTHNIEDSMHFTSLTSRDWQVDASPRPKRSAEKLKAMILREIKKTPIYPYVTDVRIRNTVEGRWAAEAVPPADQKIVHADCASHISYIVSYLRRLYDLDGQN